MCLWALTLVLLCAAAADVGPPSTEAGLPDPGWADYPGFVTLSWLGPAAGCADGAAGAGGGRRGVACALPAGRVDLTLDRADFSLELRCEDETYNCTELSAARALLSDAPGPAAPSGPPPDLTALSVVACGLPADPLACLPPLAGARGARLLKISPLREPLTAGHLRGLEGVTKLRIEDASSNITSVPYDAISALPDLESFSLLGGALALGEPPADAAALPALVRLELALGGLAALPARAFARTPRLTALLLWGNKIQDIHPDAFEGLPELVNVSLNSNRLRGAPDGLLRHAPRVRRVDLYDNRLRRVGAGLFAGLRELREVLIFQNAGELTLEAGAFAELPALGALRLGDCGLARLPADLLRGARALARLDLSRNSLAELPAGLLRDARLTDLDVSRNRLAQLPAALLAGQARLRELLLGGNRLAALPEGVFADLAALVRLDLRDNLLETLQHSLFRGARSLLQLDLSGNRLRVLHADTFGVLKNLQVLSVSGNGLAVEEAGAEAGALAYDVEGAPAGRAAPLSPFSALSGLRVLSAAHNRLTAVCDDWRLLAFLTDLDLSHNYIEDVNLDFISAAIVDLRHNNITAVFPTERPDPPPATFLLGFNPYACDCALYPLLYRRDPSAFIPNMDLQGATCATPPDMQGRDVTTIDPSSLTCSSTPCPERCSCTVRPATSKFELRCDALPPAVPAPPNDNFHVDLSLRSLANITSLSLPLPPYVKYLNLSSLNLTEVPNVSGALELDLTGNRLRSVPASVFRNNVTVRLSRNPLLCSCAERELVLMLRRHRSLIRDFGNVTCGKGLVSSLSVEQLCAWRDAAVVGGSLAVLGVAIVVLAAGYYRYKREIRILLIKYGLWFGKEDDCEKLYDAFVSYAHQDEAYVIGKLIPGLERGRRAIKLCVHSRNWVIGDWIPVQIARSVENSRRTIIVLSPHFLSSVWGHLEFRAAHGRDRVVVLLLGDVDVKDLDPELKAYVSMNTYVRADDPLVWDRLKQAVRARRKAGPEDAVHGAAEPSPAHENTTPDELDVQIQNEVLADSAIKSSLVGKSTPNGLDVQLKNGMLVNTAIKSSPVEKKSTSNGLDPQLRDRVLISTIKLPADDVLTPKGLDVQLKNSMC